MQGDDATPPSQGTVPLPEDVVPFDAASETPVEEQRAAALLRIQECLREGRAPQALRLRALIGCCSRKCNGRLKQGCC